MVQQPKVPEARQKALFELSPDEMGLVLDANDGVMRDNQSSSS